MQLHEEFLAPTLPEGFHWLNEPPRFQTGHGLEIWTGPQTDFWQNTHYGFVHDDGHCLLLTLRGDFVLSTHVAFEPRGQYDQCGLMVRADAENWIKVATEYENTEISRLGSVVTNLGYSDWATQDIASTHREMWYRLTKQGPDFTIENSYDGQNWLQMRITHLHHLPDTLEVGVYACSPIVQDTWCRFEFVSINS